MSPDLVLLEIDAPGIATITLNDPDRRNALGRVMFETLQRVLESVGDDDAVRLVLLRGAGKVFCSGFDLEAAVDDPDLMGTFIERLSRTLRILRRLPQPVVIAAHGAAIAGGCALLSAGDFVVISRTAKAGYPVHALGVSPAVTIPTLQAAIGPGAARALLLGGKLLEGAEAHRLCLASHLVDSDGQVEDKARALCLMLATKPAESLRVTKAWLNELDHCLDDDRFERPARGSTALTRGEEARALLRRFWETRSR